MNGKKQAACHVIASQGIAYLGEYPEKYLMQIWVENINTILRDEGYKVCVFSCAENRRSFVKDEIEFSISKRLRVLEDAFSFDIPVRILIKKQPLIAVIHGLQHLLTLFSFFIYFLCKVPVLIIVHGLYPSDSVFSSLRDRLLKFILRLHTNSYFLIALTNYDKQLLSEKWGIPDDRIKITRIPLYLGRQELRLVERIKTNNSRYIEDALKKPRFLYVGRLSRQKRVNRIIRVFYRLLKCFSCANQAELILVGGGPLKGSINAIIEKLGLQGQAKMVGVVSEEEKWLHYLTSTALVLASEFEGLPRVIFEAFAAGKIVIAPDICGLKEFVCNGVNGFIFNDDKEFLEALHLVLDFRSSILIMGGSNRRLVETKFTLESNKEEIVSLIAELTN